VSLPYPLYAAITRSADQLELTPHEVLFPAAMDACIPTGSLGRTFYRGEELRPGDAVVSKDWYKDWIAVDDSVPAPPAFLSPEPSLAFLLACFASAHPTRIGRMLEELIYTASSSRREPLLRLLHALLHDTLGIGHESAFQAATVPSFLFGLDEQARRRLMRLQRQEESSGAAGAGTVHRDSLSRTLQLDPSLSLMDAGLAFNLPFPPLLHPARGVDLILALDASSPPEALRGDALRLAAEYAARNQLHMPDLARGVQMSVTDEGFDEARAEAMLADVAFSSLGTDTAAPSDALSVARSLARASEASCTVFPGDASRGVPTVVYIPLLSNPRFVPSAEYVSRSGDSSFDPRRNFVSGGFCATLNFTFAQWQSDVIVQLSEANARQALPVLRAASKRIWREKQRVRVAREREAGKDGAA